MFNTIRKNQKGLMFIIAVLTIIAFAWLYNPADTQELGTNVAARVYGRTMTRADIDRLARLYPVALALGQLDLIGSLGGASGNENSDLGEFVWNLLVLRHEAAALGIEPTTEQLAGRVRNLPAFQTNGTFDPRKFESFTLEQLGPRGMTSLQVEEIMRDAFLFDTLRSIVGSPASVSPEEKASALRHFQKADILILPFPVAPARDTVKIIEAQARDYFNRNTARFTAPATATVEYAKFSLPESARNTQGRERVAALQELAGHAADFVASKPDDFAAAAKQAGAEAGVAGPFDRQTGQQPVQQSAQNSSLLPAAITQAVFSMAEDSTISDVMQVGDAFYVIKVTARTAERPKAFEEVKDEAFARVREIEAARLVHQQATEAVAKIRASVQSGASLAEAAAAAGVVAQSFAGVDPAQPELPENFRQLAQVSALLNPGQVSNPVPMLPDGFASVGVVTRALDAQIPEGADLDARLLENNQNLLFAVWLDAQRAAADIVLPRRGGGSANR